MFAIHPAPSTTTAAPPPVLDVSVPSDQPTVLLVEDDPNVSLVISTFLRYSGFAVVSVAFGPEGLQQARHLCPDIVVLDVDLPGMSGLEICRQLKADPQTRSLPVVFCSGQAHLADEARSLGAAGFVVKPDGVLELADRLREILALRPNTGPG